MPDLLDGFRRPHVSWLSFDPVVLRRLRLRGWDNLVRLHAKAPSGRDVATHRRTPPASAYDAARSIGTDLVAKAHRRGLDVLVWTHRAENQHLPSTCGSARPTTRTAPLTVPPSSCSTPGVDGVITDFPEIAAAARLATAGREVRTGWRTG